MKSALPCVLFPFVFVFAFLVENVMPRQELCFMMGKKRIENSWSRFPYVEVFCIIYRILESFNFISLDKYFGVMYSC
jgi:hypothetical protein